MSQEKVSCIIPAYNEEKRIGGVLKAVSNHPLIDEIIAVDDGSQDNTKEVIKKFKNVRLIIHKKNKGNTQTLIDGITASKNKILLFVDSDLINLDKKQLADLILPVKENNADVSIALITSMSWLWNIVGIDYLCGQRVMRKGLIKDYKKIKNIPSYGLNVSFFNKHIIQDKLRLKIVKWNKVYAPFPSEKMEFWEGNKRFFKMMKQIVGLTGFFGWIYQIYAMKKLQV